MRSLEETTAKVNTAITDLKTAIGHKNTRNIVQVMNDVENDPKIDLEIIDDLLFKKWETVTNEAYNLIQYQ